MSPKSKLGRNPFEAAQTGARAASARSRKASGPRRPAAAKASTQESTAPPKRKKPPRERLYRRPRRRKPPGLTELVQELTHYWLPRIRACAVVRAVKVFSKVAEK